MRSINIYDIAKQSGVSIATVSRVLNGSLKVSSKTREKVLAVMQEKGYTPNAFARGLGLNSMKMIGVVCTDVSDTFYAKATSLVESLIRFNGFNALLCCTGNNLEDKKKYLSLLLEKRVDAVIIIGSAFKEDVDNSHIESAAQKVPVIIINGLVELPNTYCVLCDEQSAVCDNTMQLVKQGRSPILYLYDTMTYSGSQKIAGYKKGHALCDAPFDEALLVKVPKDISAVCQKVSELIAQAFAFSSVMASEDLLAIGALKALQQHKITLPVIGFNNSILAQCSTPALTSVDNMLDTLCSTAVNILTDILSGKTVTQKIVLSPKLVERETFHNQSTINFV